MKKERSSGPGPMAERRRQRRDGLLDRLDLLQQAVDPLMRRRREDVAEAIDLPQFLPVAVGLRDLGAERRG
jgi:hypothetical protein